MSAALSRRNWFSTLLFQHPSRAGSSSPVQPQPAGQRVAIIQGRHCLPYRGTLCSTCRERCPVEGAVAVERGIPRVVSDLCTGCGICQQVCPAPVNAVLLLPKRK